MKHMKAKLLFIALFIIISAGNVKSQDYHFSQFYDIPLLVNPANTGAFQGDQRVVLFYRNQWASIMNPYESFGMSFDTRIWKNDSETGKLAMGLNIMRDKAGTSELSLTQALVSVSYHQQLGETSILSAGIQGGFSQRSMNQTNLLWHNQYDPNAGTIDPTLPSGETYQYEGFNHADMSVGLLYSYVSPQSNMSSNDGVRFHIGGAFHHFNRPEKSFTDLFDHKLYSKITVHAKSTIGLAQTNTGLVPSAIYQMQGPNTEILAGLGFRFMLQEQSRYTGFRKESALTLGCFYRFNDAAIPYVALEFANYAVGVSYDTNVSGLRRATNSVGGLEINLRYINPNPFKSGSKSFY